MTNPQTRPRLLALAVIAITLVVGGLAGATLDRAIFRPTADEHSQTQSADPWLETGARGWPGEGMRATGMRGEGMRGDGMRGAGLSRDGRQGDGMRGDDQWGDTASGPGLPPRPRQRARHIDALTRELDLSAEQRARVESLLQRQQEQMRGLHLEMRQRRDAVVAETRAGIFEILTPEQQTILRRTMRR